MSTEAREYLAEYARQETARVAAKQTDNRYIAKREVFYPRNAGSSTNKRISTTGSWRK